MDREKIINKAHEYGFTLYATNNKYESGKIKNTIYHFLNDSGINLRVDDEGDNFELIYLIPKSIFSINCPSCSPFFNSEHFYKMYNGFEKVVKKCNT